jgi:hypothetical protein
LRNEFSKVRFDAANVTALCLAGTECLVYKNESWIGFVRYKLTSWVNLQAEYIHTRDQNAVAQTNSDDGRRPLFVASCGFKIMGYRATKRLPSRYNKSWLGAALEIVVPRYPPSFLPRCLAPEIEAGSLVSDCGQGGSAGRFM